MKIVISVYEMTCIFELHTPNLLILTEPKLLLQNSNDNGNYPGSMYRLQVAPWSIVHSHGSGQANAIVPVVSRERRSSWDEISE